MVWKISISLGRIWQFLIVDTHSENELMKYVAMAIVVIIALGILVCFGRKKMKSTMEMA